jgi:hypothetical protein
MISASNNLKMAAKYILLKYTVKSQRIIGNIAAKLVTGCVSIPSMAEIYKKSLRELSQLNITEIMWYDNSTLGFKLSDG